MNDDQQTYITKKGLKNLKSELDDLKNDKRKEIAERISQAKELGDLSENAEYQSARNDQAFNEGRILELEAVLKNATIIEELEKQTGVVNVGSKIKIKEDSNGQLNEKEYHIVGSHEANPSAGRISNESPIGKALLGASKGQVVEITLPKGTIKAEIIEIK
jgi:transcription elongation factor GreA